MLGLTNHIVWLFKLDVVSWMYLLFLADGVIIVPKHNCYPVLLFMRCTMHIDLFPKITHFCLVVTYQHSTMLLYRYFQRLVLKPFVASGSRYWIELWTTQTVVWIWIAYDLQNCHAAWTSNVFPINSYQCLTLLVRYYKDFALLPTVNQATLQEASSNNVITIRARHTSCIYGSRIQT